MHIPFIYEIYSTNIFSVGLSVWQQKAKELRYLWMLSSLLYNKTPFYDIIIKYPAKYVSPNPTFKENDVSLEMKILKEQDYKQKVDFFY